ncbi:MAG: twin-arginine translocase subunit TatC [Verrucomicrobiota bacterium]|jgi:sec-independent protein translocase protein TatC
MSRDFDRLSGSEGPSASSSQEETLKEMGLLDHLEELRDRITRTAIVWLICALPCCVYSLDIIDWLMRLNKVSYVQAIAPAEIFTQQLWIGATFGAAIALPYIIGQIWGFVAPALYSKERGYAKWTLVVSYLLFILGATFALFVIMPTAMDYFASLQTDKIRYQPQLQKYVDFTLLMACGVGLLAQLPVLVVLGNALGLFSREAVASRRRHVIVGIFICAGILTPSPDVLSQCLVACPTYIIFELSLLVCKVIEWRQAGMSKAAIVLRGLGGLLLVLGIIAGVLWGAKLLMEREKAKGPQPLVENPADAAQYLALLGSAEGEARIAEALAKEGLPEEQRLGAARALVSALREKQQLKEATLKALVQYSLRPSVTILGSMEQRRIDLAVEEKLALPFDLELQWVLSVDDRDFLWPDAETNFRASARVGRGPASVIRPDAGKAMPLLEAKLAKPSLSGARKVILKMKPLKASDAEGKAADWMPELEALPVELPP